MALAKLRIGLPLRGMLRTADRVMPAPAQPGDWGAWTISGMRFADRNRLVPWPSIGVYANTANAFRISRMFNIKWGDGTADLVRHSRGDGGTGFNGFHEQSSGAWTSRSAAINLGTDEEVWGSDVCPGNAGKGYYLFSKRAATVGGPWTWDGGAIDAVARTASPGRHVVNFADRGFIFNQVHGGTVQARRSQWSVPGDCTTYTGFGSGNRTLYEVDGDITAVGLLRNVLFAYGASTAVMGQDQFIPSAPVRYDVVSRTMGVWGGFVADEDAHYMLTRQGFRCFDGSEFRDIGPSVNAHVLSRINRSAINRVIGLAFGPWQSVIWGLPMDGATEISELWQYDYARSTWNIVDANSFFASQLSAWAISDQTSAPTWDAATLAGMLWDGTGAFDGINRAGRRWIDEAGSGLRPQIITGHTNGVTRILDEDTVNPTLQVRIESGDWTFEGVPVFEGRMGGSRGIVLPDDMVSVDHIKIRYRTISGASALSVYVSIDGGQTFRPFGAGIVNLPAKTGDGLGTVRAFGRVSGPTVRFAIRNVTDGGAVTQFGAEIEDLSIAIQRAGEVRVAS